MEYLIKHYMKKTGSDVSKNLCVLGKLKRKVEKAKCSHVTRQQCFNYITSLFNIDTDL